MLTKVVSMTVVAPYGLAVRFNDGSSGVHDCTGLVGGGAGDVEALRDPVYFARGFLEFGAPTWPNAFDLDPEWLRREMAAAGELRPSVAAE